MEFKLFTDKIRLRYATLEKNIKSKSNSFYDSYLDLLEETVKYILFENSVEYDNTKTCGLILKAENVKNFLLNEIELDVKLYEKLFDYIKKCNDHKHKKEKWVGKESIVNYLNVYFEFVNSYKKFINEELITFNEEYYSTIFNENEKVNNEILEKLNLQDEKIEEIFNILNKEKKEQEIVEKAKEEIDNQLAFNNFLKTSKKINVWIGKKEEFIKAKAKAIISGIVSIILGIVAPAVSSAALLMESFSIFGVVWMAMTIFLTAYVIRLKKETENEKLYENSFEKFVYDPKLYVRINTLKEKKKFLIFRIIAYILIVLDIICLIGEYRGIWSISALILEILYFVAIIINRKCLLDFYTYFDARIKYVGLNRTGKNVSLIYDLITKQFYVEKTKSNVGKI